MAELADAIDLGSIVERRGGSTPFIRTLKNRCHILTSVFLFEILHRFYQIGNHFTFLAINLHIGLPASENLSSYSVQMFPTSLSASL